MLKKTINYKLILGIIVGVVISITSVSAAVYFGTASELSYDNSSSGLSSANVQDVLDELYNKMYTCPEGYYCEKYKTTLELGDYISYIPSIESFDTDSSMTNYSSTQTIYPKELNLWRVLYINKDGTVEIVSENISSTKVCFSGQLGFQNFTGYLNILANKYINETYTVGSRYFGYNGQTEYITDTSMFTSTAPWTCTTDTSDCNTVESQGGGDSLDEKDINQLNKVIGVTKATVPGTESASTYWTASRTYSYSSTSWIWYGNYMRNYSYSSSSSLYSYSGTFNTLESCNSIRPIVILKSGLLYGGTGTKQFPMEIIG